MRKSIAYFIIIAFAVMLCGCYGGKAEPVGETRLMLDTVCSITIYDPPDRQLVSEAMELCEEYEKLFSVTIEGSDVWRVNHAGGAPVTVSDETAQVILAGLSFGGISGGLFDITIGRLSGLWNFKGTPSLPAAQEIAAARDTVDSSKISLTGNTVQMADTDAWLDLGGIAKGYIADRLASFLKEKGVKGAVIDLGGNVILVGKKPGGNLWRVGVTKPFSESGELLGTIETGEASAVTSGIYERQFESGGRIYHHILDPRTGMPVESDVVSATVIARSSMTGDALSTMFVLLGSSAAELLGSVPGFIGAIVVLDSGEVLEYGKVEFTRR